jgi:hypothetical protein
MCYFLQDVIALLLRNHHTAEPQNMQQQALGFHKAAKPLWEACETLQAATAAPTAAAAAGDARDDGDAAAAGMQLTDALLDSWCALAQVRCYVTNMV